MCPTPFQQAASVRVPVGDRVLRARGHAGRAVSGFMEIHDTGSLRRPHPETDDEFDARLVERSQRGDRTALEELVRRHLQRVRGLVFHMLLDHAAADDITQEVLLRAVRGLAQFRGQSRFSTWLYRITWNTIQNHRGRVVSITDGEIERQEPAIRECEQPERVILQRELDERIQQGLAVLSPRLRGALVLTVLERLPAHEAAELEGCSIDTLHWRVHEARRQLKEHLADYLEPENQRASSSPSASLKENEP